MKKKLVSVFNHAKREVTGVTEEHKNLLSAYVSVLTTELFLSNVSEGAGFVKTFKRTTNKYRDYLEVEVYRAFKKSYDIDEENMDMMFEDLKKRNEFQTKEFINQINRNLPK